MKGFEAIPDSQIDDYRIISTYFTDLISFCLSKDVNWAIYYFYLKCQENNIHISISDIIVEPIRDFIIRKASENQEHYVN